LTITNTQRTALDAIGGDRYQPAGAVEDHPPRLRAPGPELDAELEQYEDTTAVVTARWRATWADLRRTVCRLPPVAISRRG
jgi:hypothetical protein